MDTIRSLVRSWVRGIASGLDRLSKGKLTPNAVTWTGLVAHVFIAVMIGSGMWPWLAALLLIFFGLFDVLDGELARLQKRASEAGMLLDATTDRFKEALLYTGAAWVLASGAHPEYAALAAAAVGASISVSYVKAKGEAVLAVRRSAMSHSELNKVFADGLMRFEVRMVVLAVGLLVGQLAIALGIIAVASAYTALGRLARIMKALD